MTYYVLMMFTISIAGTGIFLLVFWMEKRFKSYSMDFLLRLMEVVFIFFLIPAMALTACLFQNGIGGIEVLEMESEDFQYMYSFQLGWRSLFFRWPDSWIVRFIEAEGILWLAGVLAGVFRGAFVNYRIGREIKRNEEHFSEQARRNIQEQAKEVRGILKIRKMPPVKLCRGLDTPILYGGARPSIMVNSEDYTPEEIKLILLHEGIHYKRGDLLFKNMAGLISIVYWFNPVIKILVKEFYDICELSCDERVISLIEGHEKKRYAKLIGETSTSFLAGCSASALKASKKNIIIRRLENMLNQRKKSAACMAAIACILAIASPAAVLASNAAVIQTGKILEEREDKKRTVFETVSEVRNVFSKIVEEEGNDTITQSIEIAPRGTSSFSVDLIGKKGAELSELSLELGDTISISAYGENETDQFKISISDSSGNKQSVYSSNGQIVYNFKVEKKGKYKITIVGTTDSTVHIDGIISIR